MSLPLAAPVSRSLELPEEAATLALGAALAGGLLPGLVVHLRGDLGVGKTTLVRGLLRAMGYQGPVKSPTYSLVELYTFSRLYLYHFDFYRLKVATEWIEAGFADAFDGTNVCLLEWPERADGSGLPVPDLEVCLEIWDEGRTAHLRARTEAGAKCLSAVHA